MGCIVSTIVSGAVRTVSIVVSTTAVVVTAIIVIPSIVLCDNVYLYKLQREVSQNLHTRIM
jgi:hypothetical protein